MSKLYILLLSFALINNSFSQRIFIQPYIGYNYVQVNTSSNYRPAGNIPLGIKAGIGSEVIQFGAEYSTLALPTTYFFNDPYSENERFTEKFKEDYLGGLIRLNFGDRDYTHLNLTLGAGILNINKELKTTNLLTVENSTYKNNLQCNGGLGLSISLSETFHINVDSRVIYSPRPSNLYATFVDGDKLHQINYGILLGISGNF
ncbi:hypothetical protein GCM10028805_55690 [Spirosoma harenae]